MHSQLLVEGGRLSSYYLPRYSISPKEHHSTREFAIASGLIRMSSFMVVDYIACVITKNSAKKTIGLLYRCNEARCQALYCSRITELLLHLCLEPEPHFHILRQHLLIKRLRLLFPVPSEEQVDAAYIHYGLRTQSRLLALVK